MNFLSPWFLLGAAAIAGPILFHLIRQTTKERTLFSIVRFLRPTPPRLTRKSRLEHLLLLLLRCAALGLLALGFARPFFRQSLPPEASDSPARRIVVLLDTSASMRRPGAWEDAKAKAAKHIRDASPADQLALISFDRTSTLRFSFQQWEAADAPNRANAALAALENLSPTWLPTSLGPALIRAAEELADTDVPREGLQRRVYLVSDLQEGARLDPLQSYEWPRGIEVIPDPVRPSSTGNASLQWIAESPDADRGNQPVMRVRVANSADSKREQFELAWTGVKPAIAPLKIYVPAGQARIVTLATPTNAPAPGSTNPAAPVREAALVLTGDDEPFDNTLHLTPPQPLEIRILYIGSDSADAARQPLFFLTRALPESRRQTVRIETRKPADPITPALVEAARLVVVTEPLPDATASLLRERMEAGQTVVFAPATAAAGATLGRLIAVPGTTLTEERPANFALFGQLDFRHPLLAPFADPRFSDFTRIHFWRHRAIATPLPTNAHVVARFDSRHPAWVDFPVGRGRLLFLASGWSTTDSQFALSSKFVPWLYALLDLAGSSTAPPTHPSVGESIGLPAGRTANIAVRRPDGSSTNLPPDADVFADTRAPGIYWIGEGNTAFPVAVNLDPSESRTAPLATDQLERLGVRLEASLSSFVTPESRKEGIPPAAEAENRQKLWRWLVLATLAVLLGETLIAGITSRRTAPATA